MTIDQTQLISSTFPLVGGGAIGFGAGYIIKKLMKLAFIALGLLALLLGYLEYQRWIMVNWTIAENQSSAFMTHVANRISVITQHMGHEIPIAVGVLGFVPSSGSSGYYGQQFHQAGIKGRRQASEQEKSLSACEAAVKLGKS